MPLRYYGDSLSPNIIKRPSGGIICKNVPIGRTGDMYYLGRELGVKERETERFRVSRDAADVFDEATLASFEGVPVTDGHPPEDVTANNFGAYVKGHVQNVRRGSGINSDKIVADLFIDDAILAEKVLNKVNREVSSGYNCRYLLDSSGSFQQKLMRGNHVAVVRNGRAGKSVAIQDSKPESKTRMERRTPLMGKVTSQIAGIISLAVRGAKDVNTIDEQESIARDAAAAIDALVTPGNDPNYAAKAEAGATPGTVEAEVKKTYDSGFESKMLDAMTGLKRSFDAMTEELRNKEKEKERAIGREEEKRKEAKDAAATDVDGAKIHVGAAETRAETLDELTKKLTGDTADAKPKDADNQKQEEAVTVNAETMDASYSVPTAKDAAADILRHLKPSIAAIQNPEERKRVIDSLVKAVEPLTNDAGTQNTLGGVMNVALTNGQAQDASAEPDFQAYEDAYAKRNPHTMAKRGDVQ